MYVKWGLTVIMKKKSVNLIYPHGMAEWLEQYQTCNPVYPVYFFFPEKPHGEGDNEVFF